MVRFAGGEINVPSGVFSPRLESEFWIKKVIQNFSEKKEIEALDIFSGSGCLGISLLVNLPPAHVDFIDISPIAIESIRKNLFLNSIEEKRYRVFLGNLFVPIKKKKYNLIVANPPYVARKRIGEVSPDVLRDDPPLSLFGGEDGLDLIYTFLLKARDHLFPNGFLYMELDPKQKEIVDDFSVKNNWKTVWLKDQFGLIRCLEVRLTDGLDRVNLH